MWLIVLIFVISLIFGIYCLRLIVMVLDAFVLMFALAMSGAVDCGMAGYARFGFTFLFVRFILLL